MQKYQTIPLSFSRYSSSVMQKRSKSFLEVMKQRRSVRQFSQEPVPIELIRNAIETAGSAPSGANKQPWTFVLVSDQKTKEEIRYAAEKEEQESYTHRMSKEWLQALAPLGTDWNKPHLTEAPHLLVVFEQTYGIDQQGRRSKHYYVQESVGIAVGMLLASLHYVGLATLTHTPSPMKFLQTLLERPENERPFVLIPIGFPAKDCHVPAIQRKDIREIMVSFSKE